ncbi:zinc-dependent metalloprotease [Roseivirga misakiensis]|uniref:Peptidase n=1 Tax=Roseivirga misakiensis TaxID=1563681 RepID=A0A1E5SYF5_9BACT|nr:zinc-dependent metalloprotease [Roseivirga misakiensis]OEK04150.1 peptidase [Roseivirga misakiensis]
MLRKTLTITVLCLVVSTAFAQKSISSMTKDMVKKEGYFDYYWDEKTGKVWLEIEDLNKEFLYVNSLSAGIGSNDIGLDRGQLGSTRIVEFRRVGPKVMLVQPNYSYRAVSDNPDEIRAVKEAFAESVLQGFKVGAESNGKILIDITSMLLSDAHGVAGRLRGQGSYRVDGNRSAIYPPMLKNFPKNSEFEATITFTGNATGGFIRSVTPTSSAVTVRMHHSFIELPDANYEPRKADPRSGYGTIRFMDYATPIQENIVKQFSRRHRLEKKRPNAKMSDPVEPIRYYVDRGAPEPIKSALIEGARWWNQAFEAAGYRNAFIVEEMPEGADPLDVRYNVIQWVHRSTRGWSYGSSVTDPRTGEIIKGHVSLGSLRVRQDFLIAQGLLTPYENGTTPDPKLLKMALARLRQLSAHEVGHTIGLMHNYASSVNDRASVMDYPHPLIELKGGEISLDNAYDVGIGDWDKAAVTWGYQDFPDKVDEDKALDELINDQIERKLYFITDADSRPIGSSHPEAHLWDNGKSPVSELNRLMEVRAKVLDNFSEKNIPMGAPMAKLEEVLVPMYMIHRYQLEGAVKVLGGTYYNYKMRGDAQPEQKVVPRAEQEGALDALLNVITPNNLAFPDHIIAMIPPRPPGNGRSRETFKARTGLNFDPVAPGETIASAVMSFIFNPQRATRLVQQKAMDSNQMGLIDVIDKIQKAINNMSTENGYHAELKRAVEKQLMHGLMNLYNSNSASGQARAEAAQGLRLMVANLSGMKNFDVTEALKRVAEAMSPGVTTNGPEEAHKFYISNMIVRFFNNPGDLKIQNALSPPDGSPIGTDLQDWCSFGTYR